MYMCEVLIMELGSKQLSDKFLLECLHLNIHTIWVELWTSSVPCFNPHIDNPDKIELEVSREDTPMLLYYDGSIEHPNYHSMFLIVSLLGFSIWLAA